MKAPPELLPISDLGALFEILVDNKRITLTQVELEALFDLCGEALALRALNELLFLPTADQRTDAATGATLRAHTS